MAGFEADPHDPWNWAGVGELLMQLETYADAVEPLSNALALAPGWQDAEEALAAALLLTDRPAELLERFERAEMQPLDSAAQAATLLASALLEQAPSVDRCDAGAEESVRRILRRLAATGRTDLLGRLEQGLRVPLGA